MTGQQPPPGHDMGDQPTYVPGGDQSSSSNVARQPPSRTRVRWPAALLAFGLALLLVGAAIIVLTLTNDSASVATSPDGSGDVRTTAPTLPDRDNPAAGPGSDARSAGARTTTPPTTSPPADPAIPAPSEVANKYVAIVWSEERGLASDSDVEARVAEYRALYGDGVFGVRDGSFSSLRDGTVAVALDNGFTSALQAAQWCRNLGLSGDYGCVGVLLDDSPYSQDERGDYTRRYPEEL